jgi:anti-anti-sigma factor
MSYESRWTGPLRVRHDVVMGIQVLTLDGGLDGTTSSTASQSVDDALERKGPLVLDLGRLRSIDAAGTALVRASLRRLLDADFVLSVVRPRALNPARTLGGLCGAVGVPVVDTLSMAIEAVSPWRPGAPRWTPERSMPVSRDEPPRRSR